MELGKVEELACLTQIFLTRKRLTFCPTPSNKFYQVALLERSLFDGLPEPSRLPRKSHLAIAKDRFRRQQVHEEIEIR